MVTLTAISLDRLLAVMLGLRYRQVVTLSKVCVLVVSTWCYFKIYLTLRQHQAPPRTTERRRDWDQYSTIQEDGVQCIMGANNISWFSYPIWPCRSCSCFQWTSCTTSLPRFDVTFSFVFFNASLNPLLYCWKMREVRQAVKDTIRGFLCAS